MSATATPSLYDIPVQRLAGGPATTLAEYRGRALLVVNTASACGLTPQYEGLEALQRTYGPQGLAVLGFPSNQFGGQEPGTAEEIASFCATRFDVSFPLFAKTDVNGPHAHPLFDWLKQHAPGPDGAADIRWNFGKFLVGRDGSVIARYDPKTPPEAIAEDVARALA